MRKTALRLPKLKTRDELLRTAPELGRLLAADGPADSSAAAAGLPRSRSPAGKRSPGRPLGAPARKFRADEMTEEEHVRAELERVKAERAALLASLAKLRGDAGKSGGELQQEDIRLLRRELEAKQERLNELRHDTHELGETLEQLQTEQRDCAALMPQARAAAGAAVGRLEGELAGLERDMVEAEAKHELYKLLEARTRRDHAASEQRMREARALREGAADDHAVLTKQAHEMRAAREDAERELGAVVAMYDQVRGDWQRKLKDRRKEVRELERRRAEDAQRKEQAAALVLEKARQEADRAARSKAERDAANARLSVVVPELECLEATWARLHGICGACTAEDLIAHWQELKAKEAGMRELVRLAEAREARAKEEMVALLTRRAEVFESDTARGSRSGAARPGQDEQAAEEASGQGDEGQREAGEQGEAAAAVSDSDAAAPEASESLPAAPAAAPAAAPPTAEQQLQSKQAAIAEARRRRQAAQEKFAKLSQVCVAADQGLHLLAQRLKAVVEPAAAAGADRRRTSVAGARRVTSQGRRPSIIGGHQPVRRVSVAGLIERRGTVMTLMAAGAADAPSHVPAGAGIHDRDIFFPGLPSALADVGGRLVQLMALVEQMQAGPAPGADAAPAAGSANALSGSTSTVDDSLASSLAATEASEAAAALRASSRKLKWADGQGTPRAEGADGEEGAQADEGSADSGEESAAAAAQGEKALRKGFRRRTWAGPAWLEAIAAGKPLTTALRKQLGPRGTAAAGRRRVVGMVEEPSSSGDEGSTPFNLGSSEDELEESEGGVVDRVYLKHRAHRVLAKAKAKQAADGASGAADS